MFSGFLHELLVGVPTHNILGVAFVGMVVQLPVIWVTLPLEKMQGGGKVLGIVSFGLVFVWWGSRWRRCCIFLRGRRSMGVLVGRRCEVWRGVLD